MATRSIRRRTAVAVLAVGAIVCLLGVKLVDIQVVRAAEFDSASASKRTGSTPIYGERGQILDAEGTVLADNVMRYDVSVSPSVARQSGERELREATDAIGAITGQGGAAVLGIIDDALKENPDSLYALVEKDVDVATFDKLDKLDIPWLYFSKHYARSYPDGAVAGNLLGFVSAEGKPQAGVEKLEDACLAGENGEETYRRSEDNVAIPGTTIVTKPAKDGSDVKLTIDADLQWFAQQKLAETLPGLGAPYGFVLVQEAKTGKVRVAAQSPTVDPNDVDGTPEDFWGARMFSSPYEPGSTFKALTAAMLVDQGLADPTSQVLAPYLFESGNGAKVTDTDYHQPERLTLTGVLMESSNTGMSLLGQRLDDQQRYDYMTKLGLGEKTAVGFPGESGGILHPTDEWDDQTKYATMFGQGLATTPMQMLSAFQTLGNGGVRMPVRIVEGCVHDDGTVTEPSEPEPVKVFSPKAAQTTLEMMESVSTEGPISKTIGIPGYRIAAKTGTAQQPDGEGGYRSTYYVSVMGVVPVDDPQYVVSVNIAYPTTITWSMAAAPLFKTIMTQVLKTYRVKPSTQPSPDYPPYY